MVLDDLLTELGAVATKSEATRETVPTFLERRAMFGGACNRAAGAGNVENCGLGAVALFGVARAWFLCLRGLVLLEGTPLCPSLIQLVLRTAVRVRAGKKRTAQLYLWRCWRAAESHGLLISFCCMHISKHFLTYGK